MPQVWTEKRKKYFITTATKIPASYIFKCLVGWFVDWLEGGAYKYS